MLKLSREKLLYRIDEYKLANKNFRAISSDSMGKCPLYFRQILVKNIKRHCEHQHNAIDTEKKYKKPTCETEKKYY